MDTYIQCTFEHIKLINPAPQTKHTHTTCNFTSLIRSAIINIQYTSETKGVLYDTSNTMSVQDNVSARQLHMLLHEYYLHNIARVVQTDAAITRTHHWTPTQSAETTMKNITAGTKHTTTNTVPTIEKRSTLTNRHNAHAYVAVHNTTHALYSDINMYIPRKSACTPFAPPSTALPL